MSTNSTSIASGVLVALLGIIPLLWLVSSGDTSEESSAPPSTVPAAPVAAESSETIVTTPPPAIEGLPESITRVLVTNGYASQEAVDELPGSVARTLARADIALTIAEEGKG